MAEKSLFGIDPVASKTLDFELATKRVIQDIKSDFILAPHFSCVFADCADMLVSQVKSLIDAGKFSSGLPFMIDVPKKQRVRAVGVKRAPPNFVRPGGILRPKDRLLLQALADKAQPIIESKLNRQICFSHQPAMSSLTGRMFKASRSCWSEMQGRLKELADSGAQIVIRADVASCFQSINQHTLVNTLEGAGYPKELVKPLESILIQMSTGRSSRGLLQGIFPSDLFGNFYLYPIDRHFSDSGVSSVRYVDDLFAFFKSHDDADRGLIALYPELRKLDLTLNEAKSCVTTPLGLLTNDPDLDALFQGAVAEIEAAQASGEYEEVWTDYGFQVIWDDEQEPLTDEDIELKATELLFDQIPMYVENVEEIERFCLPLFSVFGSDYALDHVLQKVETTPSMAQIYFSYLAQFLNEKKVTDKIASILINQRLTFDWEYIWAIGVATQLKSAPDEVVAALLKLAKDRPNEAVKAMAMIAAAKLGDVDRQKTVIESIGTYQSLYMHCAIVFAARFMHKANRKNVLDLLENKDTLLGMVAASTKRH